MAWPQNGAAAVIPKAGFGDPAWPLRQRLGDLEEKCGAAAVLVTMVG